jgi:ribose 5-phosphate isomerase B
MLDVDPYSRIFSLETRNQKLETVAMKIVLGADHAGFELKNRIREHLRELGIAIEDKGTNSPDSCDYPDFARAVAEDVAHHRADFGILVCGTGIGMSMAANKVTGIRAAHVTTDFEAQMAREHNDANVLTIGARVVADIAALHIVDTWLNTRFAAGRHQNRVDKIMSLETIAK